jgi:hypothetical protein
MLIRFAGIGFAAHRRKETIRYGLFEHFGYAQAITLLVAQAGQRPNALDQDSPPDVRCANCIARQNISVIFKKRNVAFGAQELRC